MFELIDLLWTADNTLQLPCRFRVTQVLPLDHVQTINLHVEVQLPHIGHIDVLVVVRMEVFFFAL